MENNSELAHFEQQLTALEVYVNNSSLIKEDLQLFLGMRETDRPEYALMERLINRNEILHWALGVEIMANQASQANNELRTRQSLSNLSLEMPSAQTHSIASSVNDARDRPSTPSQNGYQSVNDTTLLGDLTQPAPGEDIEVSFPADSGPKTYAKIVSSGVPHTKKKPRAIPPLPPPKPRVSPALQEATPASHIIYSDTIPQNIHGQRIDRFDHITETDYRRIQKLHLCNKHFLRKECFYGNKCSHAHSISRANGGQPDGSLADRDMRILKQVSRYAPCKNGPTCNDEKCTFGHRCPVEGNPFDAVGKKNIKCRYGKDCKFPVEMHGIDVRVVNGV